MTEDAVSGPGVLVPRPVRGLTLKWRNTEALRRLAYSPRTASDRVGTTPTTPSSSAPAPTGWSRPTGWPTPAGRSWCWRHSPRSAAPCAATGTCTRTSCTTRSARSTRWPRRHRRSGPSTLERHGLRWRHAPAVLGHPMPDGDWALLHRDRERTASMLEGHRRGDGEAWLAALRPVGRDRPQPPRRTAVAVPAGARTASVGLARLRRAGGLGLVRTLLTPANELGRSRFAGAAPRLLLAGNAGHADIPLDAPGSGLMGRADVDARPDRGLPGARRAARAMLSQALARRLEASGGEIRTDAEVVAHRGRPRPGDRRTHRRREPVRRPPGRRRRRRGTAALPSAARRPATCPRGRARAMDAFQLDPGTVKVDWALDGPVPWRGDAGGRPGHRARRRLRRGDDRVASDRCRPARCRPSRSCSPAR